MTANRPQTPSTSPPMTTLGISMPLGPSRAALPEPLRCPKCDALWISNTDSFGDSICWRCGKVLYRSTPVPRLLHERRPLHRKIHL